VRPIASLLCDDSDALLRQIEEIFREIAPVFQPQLFSSTKQLLQTKAKEIAARLFVSLEGTRRQSKSSMASSNKADDDYIDM
jgi:hypothetical protein